MPTANQSMLTARMAKAESSPDAEAYSAKPLSTRTRHATSKRTVDGKLYAALIQATGRLVWRSLADGSITDGSPWSAFTGLSTKRIKGWGWLDVIHEDDRERVIHLWRHAAANNIGFELEYRIRRYDGAFRRLAVRVAPVRNPNGSVREWVNVAADVTRGQERDAALSESGPEQTAGPPYTGALPESDVAGLMVVNKDGMLAYVNTRIEQALGKRSEELVGRDVRDVFPEAFALPFYREYERVLADGEPATFEAFYPPLEMWVEMQLYPTADGIIAYVNQSVGRGVLEEALTQSLMREQNAHAEAETASRRLRQLQEMTDAALTHVTVTELVPSLLEHVCAFMMVTDAAILLFPGPELSLGIHAGCGAFAAANVRMALGRAGARQIAASHQPLIDNDFSSGARAPSGMRDQPRAIAGTPLLVDGHCVGAVFVGEAPPRTFAEPDVRLLKLLSNRIALLIDRIQLHELAGTGYAEAEARASELAATFAAMTDGVFVTDRYGRASRSNQAFRRLLGLDLLPGSYGSLPDDWISLIDARDTIGLPISPEDMPHVRILRGVVLHGPTAMDLTLRALDGRIVDVNVTGAPVRATDGAVIGAVVVYRDVTRRRRLQRQVADQARQLEGTFDAMADSVVVFDSAGTILRNNAADRAMFGFDATNARSPHNIAERSLQLMLRDEHGRLLVQKEWPAIRVLRGDDLRGNNAVEIKARSLDGREVELSESGAPMYDESGQMVGGVLVIRDVTERRKLELRTREALGALLNMAEALVAPPSADGVSTSADVNAVIGRLGELTRSILGCSRMSFLALDPLTARLKPMLRYGWPAEVEQRWNAQEAERRLQDFVPESLIERLHAGDVVINDATKVAPPEWHIPGVNLVLLAPLHVESRLIGLLTMDFGGQPHQYTADERQLAGAVAQFATIVIERERLLREREEALASELVSHEATKRMELFMAMASHEFRTPLAVIKRYVEIAERYLDASAHDMEGARPGSKSLQMAQISLGQVDHAAAQMSSLLNDLLQVSRAQVGKLRIRPQPCELISIVRACVVEQQQMNPTRQLHVHLPRRGQAHVVADPVRIEQVVTNYLTNAIKYAPESQPIDVRIQMQMGTARVSVTDRGPGLAPIEQERVWERFYQAADVESRSRGDASLGLGLYVCHMIVDQHGGRVGVDSSPGSGSTFWFTLPLLAEGA